jgi:hypothetical protein
MRRSEAEAGGVGVPRLTLVHRHTHHPHLPHKGEGSRLSSWLEACTTIEAPNGYADSRSAASSGAGAAVRSLVE